MRTTSKKYVHYAHDYADIIRRIYPVRGTRGVKEELPQLTEHQIRSTAVRLGLRSPHGRKPPPLTDEQKQAIAEAHPDQRRLSNNALSALSKRIGVSLQQIMNYALAEGIIDPDKIRKNWRMREIELLRATRLLHPTAAEAKFHEAGFKRSARSISLARHRFGISNMPSDDKHLTLRAAEALLGIGREHLRAAIHRGELKATAHSYGTGPNRKITSWRITRAALQAFAETCTSKRLKNKMRRNLYKLDIID